MYVFKMKHISAVKFYVGYEGKKKKEKQRELSFDTKISESLQETRKIATGFLKIAEAVLWG